MTRVPEPYPNIVNKANEVRRDNDSVSNFVMNLYEIDLAISDYMNNTIAPTVEEQGKKIQVPVIYGNSERWESARKRGYIRDQNGQVLLPLVMFQRTGFGKGDQLGSKFNRFLTTTTVERYSKKNKYDKFSVMNGVKPTKETYNIVFPDHVNLSYRCMVWTSFTEQLNQITEQFSFADDSYWGDKNKYKFSVELGNFDISNELTENQERLIRAEFDMTVKAYLLPKDFANELTTYKSFSPKRVLMMQEIDVTNVMPNANRYRENARSPIMGRTNLPQVSMISEYQPLFDYLTLNNHFAATFSSSVANGDATYSIQDSELVPTPVELQSLITETDKYQVFINGVITSSSTYSFTNSEKSIGNRDVTLVIDNSLIGFTLSANDEITVKGKIVRI